MPAEEVCAPSRSSTCSGEDASTAGPVMIPDATELTGSGGGLAAADAAAAPRSAAASACDSVTVGP